MARNWALGSLAESEPMPAPYWEKKNNAAAAAAARTNGPMSPLVAVKAGQTWPAAPAAPPGPAASSLGPLALWRS